MKIAIETGVIGLAQLYETARTGIYRVISNVSQELLARGDLDLRYCSLSSLQVNKLTDVFFQQALLGDRSFPKNSGEKLLINLFAQKQGNAPKKITTRIASRLYRWSQTYRVGKDVDIFHSMYSPLPRFRPGKGRGPVRLLTIYDIIPLLHPEYFEDGFSDGFRPIVDSFSPRDDFILTISESSKEDICSYFRMSPDRVFVTPLAASPQLYYPVTDQNRIQEAKRRFNIPDGRYFLTLATVEKRKNLAASIKSFRKVLGEPGAEDLYFVMVGTRGWKVENVLEEIAEDPLLRRRVIFTGFVHDRDLSAIYSGAEAFVYPSLYEGFGLPPLEAMQCGVPVISSNTSSLPEVVGEAGVLVDPLDTDRIAEAMLSMLQQRAQRRIYVQRGLERAAQFSWKKCADETIAGYKRAWDRR